MAELKPCPFCGTTAEMHVRWNAYEEYVKKKEEIPTGAKFLYVKATKKTQVLLLPQRRVHPEMYGYSVRRQNDENILGRIYGGRGMEQEG